MKFKIGDKVECITSGWNTAEDEVGKQFTIKDMKKVYREEEIQLVEPRKSVGFNSWSNVEGFKLIKTKITDWRAEFK